MTTTRTVKFNSNNLGSDVTLLLCFDPPSSELYRTQFPVAWKVTTLAGTGRSTLTATYEQNLGFSAPQIENGNIVDAGTYVPILPGQRTELTIKPTRPPLYTFSNPTTVGGATFSAKNSTGGPTDIGVGFIANYEKPNESMNTVLAFTDVGDTNSVKANFTPVLSAYIALDYQQNAILEAEVESETPIWSKDLIGLKPVTTWTISKSSSGRFVVTESSSLAALADDVSVSAIDDNVQTPQFRVGDKVYNALYRFLSSNAALQGSTYITNSLVAAGYSVRYEQKGADVILNITPPEGESLENAGAATVTAHNAIPPARQGTLQSISASRIVRVEDRLVEYAPVDPCTPEWHASSPSTKQLSRSKSRIPISANGNY